MTDSYYSINSMCHLKLNVPPQICLRLLTSFCGNFTQTGLDLGVTDRHRERCMRERESRAREREREREREIVELLGEIERERKRETE